MVEASAPWIGIDLGTTNSAVAIWRNGTIEIIPIMDGGRTLSSIVAYKEDVNEVLVGHSAKNQLFRNLKNTIYDAKRMIGKKVDDEGIIEF